MDLSIVTVSWNVRELLASCLESVYRSLQTSGLEFEVLVVDNASSDDSPAMVRDCFPQVRLWANLNNAGFARACNQGMQYAQGRYVALLNPDTVIHAAALAHLVTFMERNSLTGLVGPRLIYPDGSFQHSAFGFPSLMQTLLDFYPLNHRILDSRLNGRYPRSDYASGHAFRVGHPLGACMLVRRQTLEQVGPLDEGFFMYCEEIDWAMRIQQAYWRVYCVPTAEVVHYAGRSTSQVRDDMFVALWRSRFRLFAKHYEPSFNRIVRLVVRAGLGQEQRRARRQAKLGLISQEGLAARLQACARVREMTYE